MFLLNAHQRRVVTSVTLGCWLFAFFVGVVHACGLDETLGHSQEVVTVSANSQVQGDDAAVPGCEQFCAADLPLLAKVQSVQDQPGGHALPPPSLGEPLLVRVAWVPSPVHRPHPPPGIALITHYVRLAL